MEKPKTGGLVSGPLIGNDEVTVILSGPRESVFVRRSTWERKGYRCIDGLGPDVRVTIVDDEWFSIRFGECESASAYIA